jgi:uncharacterized protein (DUF779 family)
MTSNGDETNAAVAATPAALEMIDHLSAAHGPLMFVQSGGCCDGSSPMCMADGELPLGPYDLRVGEIGGAPFYIDAQLYDSWGRPQLTVDVSPGASDSFSLEGLQGVHFVTLTGSCPTA